MQLVREVLLLLLLLQMLLYARRDHKTYQGRGAQDGHLDFHTAPELRREVLTPLARLNEAPLVSPPSPYYATGNH